MSEFYKNNKRRLFNKIFILSVSTFIWLIILKYFLGKDLNEYAINLFLYMPFFIFAFVIGDLNDERNSYIQGEKGEEEVMKELSKFNELGGCFIYNNIVLPGKKWNIDHVVVSRKGVFVIETKNRSGTFKVLGSDWFYKDTLIFDKFKSYKKAPINQAKLNAKYLKEYLDEIISGDKKLWVDPVVVLVKNFKKENINTQDKIIPIEELKNTIYSEKLEKDRFLLTEVKKALDKLSESSF